MSNHLIITRQSSAEVRQAVRSLVGALSGRMPDQHGIAHGFQMRLAYGFFSVIHSAFIVKSRGGTDDAGISWPDLSPAYKAYGRRFERGEAAALKRAAGLGRQHNRSPGGKDGLLTAAQEKRWWEVYRRNLAWLAANEDLKTAKGRAAAIAWKTLKAEGARTKLDVYGSRRVEILRDTGVLLNSLSPGSLADHGIDAVYASPSEDGGQNQVVRASPGELIVGTNVAYAGPNHRRRPLWPDTLPDKWQEDLADLAGSGLVAAIMIMTEGRDVS